jgi:RNA polymerase sigma-70 factor (ECF subfamily)
MSRLASVFALARGPSLGVASDILPCMDGEPDITELLARVRNGDRAALDLLTPMVYVQLRRIAQGCIRGENPGLTLQATSLVHEAWIRLAGNSHPDYKYRAHFFGVAARLMRQILVDHARSVRAAKRGGGKVQLDDTRMEVAGHRQDLAILAVHEALERLAVEDPRKAQFVEMRFFAGMTIDEIAECSGVPKPTVYREVRVAQAWLFREAGPASDAPK